MRPRNPYNSRLPMDQNREHLMVQVAKLYYDLEKTQAEIAKELGLTRWQISKLLSEAKAEGVVKIEIIPRSNRKTSLEVTLQKRFGLSDAIVVPMGNITDLSLMTDAVASAAANYIVNLSPKSPLIGVSWGRTMSAVARALPSGWNPGTNIVLVNGATALQQTSARTSAVAEEFAQSAGGTATLLPVPAIVGRRSTRVALEKDPIVERVLELAKKASVICFGMGGLSEDSVLLSSGYLEPDDTKRLKEAGAVGDILGRFVDENGEIVDTELDDRTVGLRLDQLRKKERAIGVVSGAEKHGIALAALRAGYVSVLVTDEATAEILMEAP
ncbi:sugar-binding transcriptional regulator [Ahrensia kielensis]|uniref:Sugar-binding transcriptional regulator n=1 Tax=Ahrensia kielensis TaxID=76980 RepID=A0ABU9T2E8_9HYPH|nr:sugar-binding transcriptional regulator [Ahrensia kielensis]